MTTFNDQLQAAASTSPELKAWATDVERRLVSAGQNPGTIPVTPPVTPPTAGWNPATDTPKEPVGVPVTPTAPAGSSHPGSGTVTIEKLFVDGKNTLTTTAGIRVMNWPPANSQPCFIRDCHVRNIAASPLGSAKAGTDGAGVWVGQPGTYERLFIENAGWEGLWIGGLCRGAIFRDLNIDERTAAVKGVGIYVEHAAGDCEITNSIIRPKQGANAINFEWRYADSVYAKFDPIGDGKAGSYTMHVHNCELHGPIFVDAGSFGHLFNNLTFVGDWGGKAAISLPNHIPAGTLQSVVRSCDFSHWVGPQVAYHSNAIG